MRFEKKKVLLTFYFILIVALNDQQIIDIVLQDDYVTNVMGILECK
jgi:hypothetical protein